MITAEGGNKDWSSEHAFHPITAREEKGSPSKLPVAESLTCLKSRARERGKRREGKAPRPSALVGQNRLSSEFSLPCFTRPVLSN